MPLFYSDGNMESPHGFRAVTNEPTSVPSLEGNWLDAAECWIPSWGEWAGGFRERPYSFSSLELPRLRKFENRPAD